jgi:hypothetical protein
VTIPLALDGAFTSEQALRDMIVARKVCFDHDPFYVKDGSGSVVQIGFQLNLYAAFQDARHLPSGEDPELRELVWDLRRLCRVFFQSLDILEPCRYPDPPMHRVVYAPERRYRAEVCLQIPIFDREHYGVKSDRRVETWLETAECLLRQLGARRGQWDETATGIPHADQHCEGLVEDAAGRRPA